MFDPEKVERTDLSYVAEPCGLFVRAEDYDQLLELYRKQQRFAHDGIDPNVDVGSLPTVEEMKGLLDRIDALDDPKTP